MAGSETWTTPRDWATDYVVTSDDLNVHLRDNLTWLKARVDGHVCKVHHSTTQAIAQSTTITVVFDTDDFDVSDMHDPVTNNTRITVPKAGYYLFVFNAHYSIDNNHHYISLRKNDATTVGEQLQSEDGNVRGSWVLSLAAGDYIEARASHSYAGSMNIDANPYLACVMVGPSD